MRKEYRNKFINKTYIVIDAPEHIKEEQLDQFVDDYDYFTAYIEDPSTRKDKEYENGLMLKKMIDLGVKDFHMVFLGEHTISYIKNSSINI